MKKTLRFFNLGFAALIALVAFAMPALAQDATEEECNKIYNEEFIPFRTKEPDKAFEAVKKYQAKCTGKNAEIDKYFADNWLPKYEKFKWDQLLGKFADAWKNQNYPDLYNYGKQILNKQPENMDVIIKLGYAGYLAERANNTSIRAEASNFSQRALAMLESGKVPAQWEPFKSKDETVAWLYVTLAVINKPSPKESAVYYFKSLKPDSTVKTQVFPYLSIANYYQNAYQKAADEFNKKWENVTVTDENRAQLKADEDNVNALLDRFADALARSANIETNAKKKSDWATAITDLFVARYKKQKEELNKVVNDYIVGIGKTPMPDPASELKPAPIMEVPADDATTTTTVVKPTTAVASTTVPNGDAAPTNSAAKTSATKSGTAKKAPAKGKGSKTKRP